MDSRNKLLNRVSFLWNWWIFLWLGHYDETETKEHVDCIIPDLQPVYWLYCNVSHYLSNKGSYQSIPAIDDPGDPSSGGRYRGTPATRDFGCNSSRNNWGRREFRKRPELLAVPLLQQQTIKVILIKLYYLSFPFLKSFLWKKKLINLMFCSLMFRSKGKSNLHTIWKRSNSNNLRCMNRMNKSSQIQSNMLRFVDIWWFGKRFSVIGTIGYNFCFVIECFTHVTNLCERVNKHITSESQFTWH